MAGKLDAVIFDLDGTLIDSAPGIVAAAEKALAGVCPEVIVPDLRRHIGPPVRRILARAIPSLTEAQLVELERRYRPLYDEVHCFDCELYPGTRPVLEHLGSAGVKLFIVTNKPSLPTSRILERFAIQSHFEAVICPDIRRPRFSSKSEALAHLMEQQSLDPTRCVFIGDAEDDAIAARDRSVPFVAACYGYGDWSHVSAADGIVLCEDLAELPRLLSC